MLGSLLRLIIFIGIVVAGIVGVTYLGQTPGRLSIEIAGTVREYSLVQAAVILLVLFALLWLAFKIAAFVLAFARFLAGDETALSRYWNRSQERRGLEALSRGLMAVASGDAKTAQRKAQKAEKLLRKPELTRLLSAQAAEMQGDEDKARRYYKALMQEKSTAFVGAQGLLQLALRNEDTDRALKIADHAAKLNPKDRDTLDTLFELQSQKFDWAAARSTLKQMHKAGTLEKPELDRREAGLMLAQAEDADRLGEHEHARRLAVDAAKLDPTNTHAVASAARLLIDAGSKIAASKLISDSWRHKPDAKLAAVYADIEPDESPASRRRRFEELFALHAETAETRFLRAELALVAEDWSGARSAISDLRETQPSARSCAIMAAIARGEGEPDHVVRAWLARALGAPRDGATDSEISHAAMLPLLIDQSEEQSSSPGSNRETASKPATDPVEPADDEGEDAEEVSTEVQASREKATQTAA